MARTPGSQLEALSPSADLCVPATDRRPARDDRMARFAADSRLGRLLVIGGLIAVGWLVGVIFGVFGTATAVAEAAPSAVVTGSAPHADGFPTSDGIDASVNAEAMAGRNVDGLTSQSTPVLPDPSTADHTPGNGLIPPTSGGSIMFGDVARSFADPRLAHSPAPLAALVPPVVRTAADDPSFSPD
ncbi:hypothetical protein Aph01nite_54330 [Acrocarpospora phusangensis]|uniref:Uncharacterized protein n=1 Tax=Acrocarpospora phusangensis TaxID=1070424 RepID=A0A919UR61_9ACTN|nr:hypothetical protein [Acrocarpospora phusangensis]GIH27123.1 hypothetical protein Aph01nite_54330 [Acrocarpospora phusangensis]